MNVAPERAVVSAVVGNTMEFFNWQRWERILVAVVFIPYFIPRYEGFSMFEELCLEIF